MNYQPSYFEDKYHQEQFKTETGKELKVPETWPYYNEVARYFTENAEDGVYGTVVHGQRPYCWAFWMCRAASKGVIYFDENMEPAVNSKGGVEALENMVEAVDIGPPGTGKYDSPQVINAWEQGNAVMGQWWINITQVGPEAPVAGDQALKVMPGWEQDDGSIRRNSTIAYARVLGIPEALEQTKKDAAFYSAYRLSTPPISTHAVTNAHMGIEPYIDPAHYSDKAVNFLVSEDNMADPDAEVEGSGVSFRSKELGQEWLSAHRSNLEIGFPQPNWPGAQQYQGAMGIEVQNALTGQKSPQKALDDLAKEMRSIRDNLGREEQAEHYQQFLNTAEKFGYV
jgi:multiple sugar transport system substrate-binding protein